MKIIKRGKIKKTAVRMTCSECETIFEYEEADIKSYSDQRENYTYYWIDCSVCKKRITIKQSY